MRIEYRRTFAQFIDNYFATYYGAAGQTAFRLVGGPSMMVIAALLIIFVNTRGFTGMLRTLFIVFAILVFILGLYYMLRPALHILLVWTRKEDFIGPKDATIALEMHPDFLRVYENKEQLDLPFDQIEAIWRRARSAWVITKSDNLVYFPFEDLISGDADKFADALDEATAPDEEDE